MKTVAITVGTCPGCGRLWPLCECGRGTVHSTLDHMEPEPPLEESYSALIERLAAE